MPQPALGTAAPEAPLSSPSPSLDVSVTTPDVVASPGADDSAPSLDTPGSVDGAGVVLELVEEADVLGAGGVTGGVTGGVWVTGGVGVTLLDVVSLEELDVGGDVVELADVVSVPVESPEGEVDLSAEQAIANKPAVARLTKVSCGRSGSEVGGVAVFTVVGPGKRTQGTKTVARASQCGHENVSVPPIGARPW